MTEKRPNEKNEGLAGAVFGVLSLLLLGCFIDALVQRNGKAAAVLGTAGVGCGSVAWRKINQSEEQPRPANGL